MPDPTITKLKSEAARLSARAKIDRQTAQHAERGGLREIAAADELARQARNLFANVHALEKTRKKDLQKIHIARKDLAITDDAYRLMLQRLTGMDTTADMTASQRRSVLAEFRRFGWNATRSRPVGDNPQATKIRALWLELAAVDAVGDKSDAAIGRYCKRMTGIQRAEWLEAHQASRVIESLKMWLRRIEGQSR